MQNDRILQRISDYERDLTQTQDNLVQCLFDVKESEKILDRKDPFDIMGDSFFPDNKIRIKVYKKSIQSLIDILQRSKNLASNNQTRLGSIKELVKISPSSLPMLLMHLTIRIGITIPESFNRSSIPFVVLVLGIFLGIEGVFRGAVSIPAFVFLVGILMTITGIIRGYERKICFEEGKEICDKEVEDITREVYKPLEEISEQLKTWIENQSSVVSVNSLYEYFESFWHYLVSLAS
ncbi:uncharacterized protein LOC130614662 [Hydractinia symbiolongicarpus]|uniref:uncharacterized protein LOC130614662 n=1 Tax=Hydractinia symbiolongicarpus TaxID=13093 RepID=UPI00254C2B92|nr:uncharacterized protein LOC130614662 [Hydractinia symbiolongicarpus]